MLAQTLLRQAQTRGDQTAIVDDRGAHTYAQVAGLALTLAQALAGSTRPRVGILLPPGAAFVGSFHAALLAGKGVVPMNYLLGPRETAHIIADSGIDAIVSAPPLSERLAGSGVRVIDLGALAGATPPGGPPPRPAPTFGRDDLAVLLYTSGTSGLPKGVLLTHGNLQSTVDAAIAHASLRSEHRFLGVVPLFHSFGVTATMLAPIALGAAVVYQARFNPVAAVKAIREHRISLVFGVPSMFGAIAQLKSASAEDFASIYAIISGGEPLPPRVRDAFEQRFGLAIHEGYGLTENCGPITFNVPQATRAGTVGRAMPGTLVRVADESDRPLPFGEIGEVQLGGPTVFKGYHNLPDDTAAAFAPDGFFRTGDLGRLDPDGYLSITGRRKDLIIVAGEKVYPREIEDVIARHPDVADVAVLGRRDASRGEVVVAFVLPQEGRTVGEADIREFCRQAGLVPWKTPREVIAVAELPRSPTGKVLKRVLAEQLAAT